MSGPIACYDFTLALRDDGDWVQQQKDIKKVLKDYAKKWAFQLEEGDTGYKHFQGRFSLMKKREIHVIQPVLRAYDGWEKCFGKALSPTSTENSRAMFYVIKKDTRLQGPWTDDSDEPDKVLTRQLKEFMDLQWYDWQLCVCEMAKAVDFRSIKLIYDRHGNNGKSILCEYMEYVDLGYEIPPFRQMEDLMQCVMCIKTYGCYIIDMPRGMKKDKLGEFYAGIECIKNGVAYDKRYKFEKKRFDRPQVFVFTNVLPDFELLSRDRWVIYELEDLKLHRRQIEDFDEVDLLEPSE